MNRRGLALSLLAAAAAPLALAQTRPERLNLTGRFIQGGYALGRTRPGALVFVDGEALTAAGATGLFVVGFDRDGADTVLIEARQDGWRAEERLHVAAGDFPTQRISGLPPSTVDPTDPALLERIRREAELKAVAYASRDWWR